MSVEIWPSITPEQLKIEEDATQARELAWLLDSLQATLLSLRHGLEECYALLAPIDPGSTLVLSTPRAELVKGHVTRVGARIVKGTIHTKLRTTAPLSISINPAHPIHLPPLATLNTLITQAVDLASLCFAESERKRQRPDDSGGYGDTATFLSSQLRLLAQAIDEASAILKGPPSSDTSTESRSASRSSTRSRPGTADSSRSRPAAPPATASTPRPPDDDWTRDSASSNSFTPKLSSSVSFHVTIQDACLVLHLRALEPADAPVNLGVKFALAIGTARRLEHDEADKVFSYRHHAGDSISLALAPQQQQEQEQQQPQPSSYPTSGSRNNATAGPTTTGSGSGGGNGPYGSVVNKVYVREKVRVESADPSLLSMATKLTALSNTLGLARRNLAAVMGEEFEG